MTSSPLPSRREIVLFAFSIAALGACKRDAPGENTRCPHCGMRIDDKSAFKAWVIDETRTQAYDTPRCALMALRIAGNARASVKLQEFYTRAPIEASAARFVSGSDVEGPMGAELIPVTPDKADKFLGDHRGARIYRFEELTLAVLKSEGTP